MKHTNKTPHAARASGQMSAVPKFSGICNLVFTFLLLLVSVAESNAQIIKTIAGNGVAVTSGDGGPATAAGINYPYSVAADGWGNIYVADHYGGRVRKINNAGIISTIASGLNNPSGVAVDAAGNVFIANSGANNVLKVSGGVTTTYAGTGFNSYTGDGGPATAATLFDPRGMCLDAAGNLYITDDQNNVIRKVVAATGNIYTVAGNHTFTYTGDGGPATLGGLRWPNDVAIDAAGNLYIADALNQAIRKVDVATGRITTVAGYRLASGYGASGSAGDGGPATAAEFLYPYGIAVDAAGNLFIADNGNNKIRKVNAAGIISTFAGTGAAGYTGDGAPSLAAQFNSPYQLSLDASGNPMVVDYYNYVVRKIGPATGIFFTGGYSQNIHACQNVATPINAVLGINDSIVGENLVWGQALAPLHGTLSGTYSTISTGGISIPAGLSYTSSGGYLGRDSFVIKAANGGNTVYITVTVNVTASPSISILSPSATVCDGATAALVAVGLGDPAGGDTLVQQDFSATAVPWVIDTSGSVNIVSMIHALWRNVPDGFTNSFGTYHTSDNSSLALVNSNLCGAGTVTKSRLISPSFSTVGYTDAILYFEHSYKNLSDTSAEIDVSTDGGVTWTTVVNYSLTTLPDFSTGMAPFTGQRISLSAFVGYPNVMIRFYYNSPFGWFWAVDNISVKGYANGVNSTTWSPAANLFTNAATTSLYNAGNYIDSVYFRTNAVTVPTVFTYYATQSVAGCAATAAVTFTVTPNAPIMGNSLLCVGQNDTLTHALPYGIWSASNGNAIVNYSGIVTGMTAGIDTITYEVYSACGLTRVTKVITISSSVAAGTITGPASVCSGASVLLTNAQPGGVWASSATGVAAISGTGTVTGVASGSATISYTVTNGCGTAVATHPVLVNPLPVAGIISGAAGVCIGSSMSLASTAAGGVWSSAAAAIATIDITGVVGGVTAGATVISYAVTNGCGTDVAIYPVTVNVLPYAGVISGPSVVCHGAVQPFTNSLTSGTWANSSPGVGTISSAGMFTALALGDDTLSYTINNGCGTATVYMPVTVNPLPFAGSITGIDSVCPGYVLSLSAAVAGGVWTSHNPSVAAISSTGMVTGIVPGRDTIGYVVNNSCGTDTARFVLRVLSPTSAFCTPVGVLPVAERQPGLLEVFPNPNTGAFSVRLATSVNQPVTFIVSNLLGETVKEFTATSNMAAAVQLHVAQGIYVVSAVTATGRNIARVTVVN